MAASVISIMKSIHRLLYHYSRIPKLFKGINNPTYSQNNDLTKPRFSVILDYLYLFFFLRVLPTYYHLFQFDSKNRNQFKEYLDEPIASPFLRRKLYGSLWDDSYGSLVNDKYLFHCFSRYNELPVPEVYGTYHNGFFRGKEKNLAELMQKKSLEKIILKPLRGIQGKDIFFVTRDRISELEKAVDSEGHPRSKENWKKGHYIVQQVVRQHPRMDAMNPHSVNTVRMITFLTIDGGVEILSSMLRTSSGENPVDNFKSGGIVIGIDISEGTLKEHGYLKPEHGTIVMEHPVTRTRFSGFRIPFWDDVIETAVRAQQVFHYLKSIAWDLAISQQGPLLIEGNIEWGTAGIQAANGGLLNKKNRTLFAQYGLNI